MLNYETIKEAQSRIEPYIKKTKLQKSVLFNDVDLYLKLENQQLTNSFKLRGALSKMTTLTEEEIEKGIMTVSSGNHGAAVSYASNLLNIKSADVIVPKVTPESKINNIKQYGANVLILGEDYDDAHQLGDAYLKEHGKTYIDAYYEDEAVYAGQGTIGLEIMEDASDVDVVLVPIGGGGLITGIGTAIKGIKSNVKIIGVQTSACPAMIRAIEDNVFYDTYPIDETICDALVGGIGKRAFEMHNEIIDMVIEVKEEDIFEATKEVILNENIIAEPSSSLYTLAIKQHKEIFKGKKVVAVISGGNIDATILKNIKDGQ